MLKFFRRHNKTFFFVVTAVVIISFIFFGSDTPSGRAGEFSLADTAFTLHGREHDYSEYNRLARYYGISHNLRLSVFGGRAGFADALVDFAPRFRAREETPRDFVFNLLLLRRELEKNGIHVSDAEVKEQFRSLPIFQTNGELDRAKLEGFENSVGMYGMRVGDIHELIRDWLGLQKLIQIVAGNAVPSPYLAKQYYAGTYQTIQAATIAFTQETFKKSAEVTDEEIKNYFDQKKDELRTEEKRAVSLVLFETPPDMDKLTPEERIKKNGEYGRAVESFSNEAYVGGKLDDLAKKYGKEIKSLPAFTQKETPDDLKQEQELVFEIFRNDPKKRAVSEPVKSDKGYYFFAVTDVLESKPKELAEAQAEIKDILIKQEAEEAMMKAANDARKNLTEAIQSGKKFEDAALEAKLEPKNLPEITPTEPPKDMGEEGYQITAEAQQTPAGSFSKKPLVTENGVLLVYVKAKELRKREDSAALRLRVDDSLTMLARRDMFRAWFDRRRDEADVKSNLPDQM